MIGASLAVVPLLALALYVHMRLLGAWGAHELRELVRGTGWIDALQLLLVFILVIRVTDRVLPAVTAGLVLAVTPPLLSDRRKLQRNAVASLLSVLAMLAVLRTVDPSPGAMQAAFGDANLLWGLLAVLLAGLLFYVDRPTACAFGLSALALMVVQGDLRVVGMGLLGAVVGVLVAATRSARVKERFMLLFGQGQTGSVVWRGVAPADQSWLARGVCLVGENPFALLALAMPVAQIPWAIWLYWWTAAAVGWAVLTTCIRPLQILGPGVRYMRISVFPSAYVLAMNVDTAVGAGAQSGLLLGAGIFGCAALAYVYRQPAPTLVDAVIVRLERFQPGPALRFIVGGLVAVLAVARVEHALGAVLHREELMYGEGIIYDHAARILRGEPLYLPLNQAPYSVAAYTPVYYWIAAALQRVFGAGFGPGRVVSLLAALVAAGLVADLARRRARSSHWAGLFAAVLFLVFGFPTQGPGLEHPWFAYYKEDMLGVTFALGAIAVLDRGASRRRVVFAAALAALAVLTKQTLVAAGLAGFVWLALRQPRLAAVFAGISAALVLGVTALMELTTHAFLANVLAVAGRSDPLNDFMFKWNLGILIQFQAVPLGITAIYVVARLRDWRKALDDIMVPYALASLLPLIGLAKIGSSYNYWIDLAAITAIVTTQVIWGGLGWTGLRLGQAGRARAENFVPSLFLALLGVHLAVFVLEVHPSVDVFGALPAERELSLRQETEFQWVVERARSEPREVLSEAIDVVVLAGRPMLAEPIIFTMMVSDDQWSDVPLASRVCAGEVGLLVLKGPLEGGSELDRYMRSALWPPHVLEALRETMQLETTKAGLLVYSPSTRSTSSARLPSSTAVCPGV